MIIRSTVVKSQAAWRRVELVSSISYRTTLLCSISSICGYLPATPSPVLRQSTFLDAFHQRGKHTHNSGLSISPSRQLGTTTVAVYTRIVFTCLVAPRYHPSATHARCRLQLPVISSIGPQQASINHTHLVIPLITHHGNDNGQLGSSSAGTLTGHILSQRCPR